MEKQRFNRRQRRSLQALRPKKDGRFGSLEQMAQDYLGVAFRAGTLVARIAEGRRELARVERRIVKLHREKEGSLWGKVRRFFGANLTRAHFDAAARAGDLSYEISRDEQKLKQLYATMRDMNQEAEVLHDYRKKAEENRKNDAEAKTPETPAAPAAAEGAAT